MIRREAPGDPLPDDPGAPSSRHRLDRTVLPFAVMACVAQLSGIADGGLARPGFFELSCVLLVIGVGPMLSLRGRQPRSLLAAAPYVYIVSATFLILSQSQKSTGLSIVLLLPVVSIAIRGSGIQSAGTVAAMLVSLLVTGLDHHSGWVVLTRELVLWGAMGAVLSSSIHGLRGRLRVVQGELAHQATTDPLTGLANRRGLERAIGTRRGRRPFVMLLIDVDGLKDLNDASGHQVGDTLLQRVARACQDAARAGDVVARIGGDEFAVFVADAQWSEGQVVAERMEAAISRIEVGGRFARASIGTAAGAPHDDPTEVLARADRKMYEAKRAAREVRGDDAEPGRAVVL